jgi:hypothetical protein
VRGDARPGCRYETLPQPTWFAGPDFHVAALIYLNVAVASRREDDRGGSRAWLPCRQRSDSPPTASRDETAALSPATPACGAFSLTHSNPRRIWAEMRAEQEQPLVRVAVACIRTAFFKQRDNMKKLLVISALSLVIAEQSFAQGLTAPRGSTTTGTVIQGTPNNTGNDRNITIAPGATGASTIETDSAAGGNAGQPERAVPQGGASGSGSNGGASGG